MYIVIILVNGTLGYLLTISGSWLKTPVIVLKHTEYCLHFPLQHLKYLIMCTDLHNIWLKLK